MANLGQKDGIYHIRFRYLGREYKKSLKTRQKSAADAARNLVELTIHRLTTGQITLPVDVDPGDFILSGGTFRPPQPLRDLVATPQVPSLLALIDAYRISQKPLLAPSYHASQSMHLRHLVRHLGPLADAPADRVG